MVATAQPPAADAYPGAAPQPQRGAEHVDPSDIDLRPGDNNKLAQVHAQSVLMQSYATPTLPVDDVASVAVALATPRDATPKLHIFAVKNTGHVLHLQPSPASPTGWGQEDLSVPGRQVVQVAAGMHLGQLEAFALDTNHGVWYRGARPVYAAGNTVAPHEQSFARSEWTSLSGFPGQAGVPTGTGHMISFSGHDGRLWASADTGGSSVSELYFAGLYLVEWPVAKWRKYGINEQQHAYSSCAARDGCWVSFGLGSENTVQLVGLDGTAQTVSNSFIARKLLPPTLGNTLQVYALDDGGRLWSLEQDTIRRQTELATGVVDFAVVRHSGSADKDSVFYVTQDGKLLMRTATEGEYTTPLQLGSRVATVAGASSGEISSSFITSDTTLVQLEQVSSESYQRLTVAVRSPAPSVAAPTATCLAAGLHFGESMLHVVQKNGGKNIHEHTQDLKVPGVQRVWHDKVLPVWSHDVWFVTSVTAPSGRLHVFIIDSYGDVGMLRVGGPNDVEAPSWKGLGVFSNGTKGQKVFAGVVDGEVVLLARNNHGSGNSGVYQIPLDGPASPSWVKATPFSTNWYVNDVSFGSTTHGEGFFAAVVRSNTRNYAIDFYKPGSTVALQTFGDQKETSILRVYGLPLGVDQVLFNDGSNLYAACTSDDPGVCIMENSAELAITFAHNAEADAAAAEAAGEDAAPRELLLWHTLVAGDVRRQVYDVAAPWQSSPDPIATGFQQVVAVSRSRVFGLATDGTVRELFEPKMWARYKGNTMMLATNEPDDVTEFQAWQTTFQTEDKNRTGVAKVVVHFEPVEEDVEMLVNGRLMTLSPGFSHQVQTNTRGVATVTFVAHALHAPVLSMWTDSPDVHEDDATSVVVPNYNEQLYLSAVPTQQLQNAKRDNGDNLFPANADVDDDFADAVHATIAPALPEEDDGPQMPSDGDGDAPPRARAAHRPGARGRWRRGLFASRHGEVERFRRLNPRVCRKTCFHTAYTRDAATGRRGVRFTRGTPAEIEAINARLREGSTQYHGAYADVMQSANSGFCTVEDTSFTPDDTGVALSFGGKLRALVKFVTDVGSFVWEGVLEFAEDVVHATQSLFTHLGVFFKDMFQWLGSFFRWSDIVNTQKMIQSLAEQSIADAEGLVDKAEELIRKGVAALKAQLANPQLPPQEVQDATCDDSMQVANEQTDKNGDPGRAALALGDDNVVDENGKEAEPERTPFGDDPQGNWVLDHLLQVLPHSSGSAGSSTAFDKDVLEATAIFTGCSEELLQQMVDALVEGLKASQTVNKRGTSVSFSDMMDTVFKALANVLAAEAELMFNTLLSAAVTVVKAVFGSLTKPFHIPLLSNLWKNVICPGQDLTLLGVVSLAVAVPSTLGYKALTMAMTRKPLAPVVATDADVVDPFYQLTLEQVQRAVAWTSRSMRRAFGIKGADDDACLGGELTPRQTQLVTYIFGIIYGFTQLGLGACDMLSFVIEVPLAVAKDASGKPVWKETGSEPCVSVGEWNFLTLVQLVISQYTSQPILPDKETADWEWGAWVVQGAIYAGSFVEFIDNYCIERRPRMLRSCLGIPEYVSVKSGYVCVMGSVHLAVMSVLAYKDWQLVKGKDQRDKRKIKAKIAQNIITGVGEFVAPLRDFLVHYGAKDPEAFPYAVLGQVAYDTVCVISPGGIGIARLAFDVQDSGDHRVAY